MTDAQQSHAEATATPPLSAGTLFYLWGDKVVDASGALGGTTVPSGAKVSAKQLAPLLWAVSFARLQGEGVLQLEQVTKKTFGFKRQLVQVSPAGQPGPRGGFEQEVVQQVTAGATTAYDVVWRWFGRDVNLPESAVFALALQEMLLHGYAQVQENARKGLGGMLLGKDKVEPLPERVSATWHEFQQFQAWWDSYRRHDPALADTLLDNCRKAIRGRQEDD